MRSRRAASRPKVSIASGVIGTDFLQKLTADTPLRRFGQPEDIAKVAVFLASDQAGWITGESIVVSGGLR
jgi:3-oxoacyl-[acyl-carrier protein] reductase